MPELPEVQTVVNGLEATITGERIASVTLYRKDLRFPFPPGFVKALEAHTIKAITRRAKYIVMQLSGGTSLLIHLGMTGKLLYLPESPEKTSKHDHVLFTFASGKALLYNDARRFGFMDLAETKSLSDHQRLHHLGVEPLDRAFTGKALRELLKGKKVAIKQALMNAETIVGVGNIYASEALFRAKIHPKREAGNLTARESTLLAQSIQAVLNDAIASGGSTLRDYVRSSGDVGYFQHHFNVYGRTGKPCVVCAAKIAKITQGGRSTFYCPECQKD